MIKQLGSTSPAHPLQGSRRRVCVINSDPRLSRHLLELGINVIDGNDIDGVLETDCLVLAPTTSSSKGLPDISFASGQISRPTLKAKHIIVLSSAQIYGAQYCSTGLTNESFSIRPDSLSELSRRWFEFEQLAARISIGLGAESTVLRTCTVLSEQQDIVSKLLSASSGFTVSGRLPSLQFLSIADFAKAIARAIEKPIAGCFNLAPDDAVPIKIAMKVAQTRRIPLPAWVHNVATVGSKARRSRTDFIKYSWTVSSSKFNKTFEFKPVDSSKSALVKFCNHQSPLPAMEHDPFGLDPEYISKCGRGRFRFLEKFYWRLETRGLENIPTQGGGVLAGIHRGFMPFDGVMMVHVLNQQRHRIPRFLIHPALTRFAHLDGFLKRLGGILANQENADWVLNRNELLGIFPEGIRGAFKKYDRNIYKIGKFGRNDFVKIAVRHQVPIVPFVSLGPAESFPILQHLDWKWLKRVTGWPTFPITPTFPLLPIPLPTRWHFQLLDPVCPVEFGVKSIEDRNGVKAISNTVRARMQVAIDEMQAARKSFFFGSVFSNDSQPSPTRVSQT